MNPGSKITIVSGSRLRKVSEDNKRLLDQGMNEGALVEADTHAKVVQVIPSKDGARAAYVLEVDHRGVKLYGWCYQYEIAPHAR